MHTGKPATSPTSSAESTDIATVLFALVGVGLAILSLGSLEVIYHGVKAIGDLGGSGGFYLFIGVFAGSFALIPVAARHSRLVPLMLVWVVAAFLSAVAVSFAVAAIQHRLSYSPRWLVMPGVFVIPSFSATSVFLVSRLWRSSTHEVHA